MKLRRSVSAILLSSTLLLGAGDGTVPPSAEELDCGSYELAGRFVRSEGGWNTLQLYPDSTREFEILLENMDLATALKLEDVLVRLRVDVLQRAQGGAIRARFAAHLGEAVERELAAVAIRKTKALPCATK